MALSKLGEGRVHVITQAIEKYLGGTEGKEAEERIERLAGDIPRAALKLGIPAEELRLFFHGMHLVMSQQARHLLRGVPFEERQVRRASARRPGWWERIAERYPKRLAQVIPINVL